LWTRQPWPPKDKFQWFCSMCCFDTLSWYPCSVDLRAPTLSQFSSCFQRLPLAVSFVCFSFLVLSLNWHT
jgi:hypothetical protein